MLENIRKWLENELKECSERLSKKQEEYNIYQRKNNIEEAFKEKEDYKELMKDKFKMLIISLGLLLYFLSFSDVSLLSLPGISFAAMLFVCDIFVVRGIIRNIKTIKKMNQIIKENNEDNYFDLNELRAKKDNKNKNNTESKQKFLRNFENELSLCQLESELSNLQEYLNSIWDTLQSDDFVERLANYQEKFDFSKKATKTEWQAYLEEISHISPVKANLTGFDVCIDDIKISNSDEQIQLKKGNKREKSHNLSIN